MESDRRIRRLVCAYRTEAKIASERKDESRRLFWVRKWKELASEKELQKAPKYLKE